MPHLGQFTLESGSVEEEQELYMFIIRKVAGMAEAEAKKSRENVGWKLLSPRLLASSVAPASKYFICFAFHFALLLFT
jgi:hypothetical protein